MKKNRMNAKGRRSKDRFFMIPRCVYNHEDFISLSPRALNLLVDLGIQFNGYNNGDLCCTMSLMKKRGWTSSDQLDKAKKELVNKDMIVVARQGGRKRATLYALAWLPIDDCKGKLDIKGTNKPWRDFTFIK